MGEDQKRALLAVVLSGVILFGWQYFFAPKAPVVQKPTTEKVVVNNQTETSLNQASSSTSVDPVSTTAQLETFELRNENIGYSFNNQLVLIEAFNNNSSFKYAELFNSPKNAFSLEFLVGDRYRNLTFNVQKISESHVKLSNSEYAINADLFIDEKGFLVFNVKGSEEFKYRFVWNEEKQKLENGQVKNYSLFSDSLEVNPVGEKESGDAKLKWAGVDFNYHLLAIVFPEHISHLFESNESGNLKLTKSSSVKDLEFKLIFTKKEYDTLKNLGDKLHLSVDFGIWGIVAVPILRGLQFFYGLIPNYGISIILLTLIIRTLTFPLQYKSFKSMKKMQVIQPELTKIREKYKEDPQRLQQETMALFKSAGANPLGGCLPLLLQMPIFFAFYKVLYSSVELVHAPFYLWIKDLSEKDPYYVLPVLMAGAMFLHQKLTPSTATDPMQQKILMFMPLIFAIFMKDLPAGLTLYIFVSTIMGLLQQLIVYKRT